MIVRQEEEAYDPLSQAQKHIMLKNGTFEFDDISNTKCCCGYSVSEHRLRRLLALCER